MNFEFPFFIAVSAMECSLAKSSAPLSVRKQPLTFCFILIFLTPRSLALSKSCDNASERLIRDMVMGKKAYLFCRDLDACKRAAMMYSLFGACKVLDKNPERWLCYVLKHIDSTPEDNYYTLLPEFWEDEEQ